MKKTIKRDNIKKIALVILIMIIFNVISPISSYARFHIKINNK